MDNSTQQNDLMKYLDNEMSDPEKKDFEKELLANSALKQEMENLQMARDAVKWYGLRQQVNSVRQEMIKESNVPGGVRTIGQRRRIIRYTIAIAASTILLVAGIMGYNFYRLSPEKLYGQQYQAYELSSFRGGESSSTDLEKAYLQKNYKEVIADIQKLQSPTIEDLFLAGISYLEISNVPAAIKSFQSVIEKNKTEGTAVLKDQAEYYLALSYLRNKNYRQALDLMRSINSNPDHLYYNQFKRGFMRKVKMLQWK